MGYQSQLKNLIFKNQNPTFLSGFTEPGLISLSNFSAGSATPNLQKKMINRKNYKKTPIFRQKNTQVLNQPFLIIHIFVFCIDKFLMNYGRHFLLDIAGARTAAFIVNVGLIMFKNRVQSLVFWHVFNF